ncbi:unnamed protein product, partial [Staurois parvus]
ASVVRQAGSITNGQVGTGGSGREWSGSQARDQNMRSQQRSGSNRVSNKTGTGMQEQDTGPRKKTHTKAESAGLAIPKIHQYKQFQVFGWLQG